MRAGHHTMMRRRREEEVHNIREQITRSTAEGSGSGERTAGEGASVPIKRKPPIPTPTPAHAAVRMKGGSNGRGQGCKGDKAPKTSKKGVEKGGKGAAPCSCEMASSPATRNDKEELVLQLRQATEEIEVLRRDVASAARERVAWQQRDDDLSLTVSRLEDRCEALEGSLRAESDAADAEEARAKAAEGRFEKLLAWAREEEGRRRRAEEKLRRARDGGQALEARAKVAEEEKHESNRQLDARRLRLEDTLEELRRRTSDSDRLQAQAKAMRGEVEALRELAHARESEAKELREKVARLVQEAKGMSSENVTLRKKLSSEQERWRAAERSKAKQDERRRVEMEQKSDDVHALRYRVQELEARVLSEAARRQGAEDDARRSQEMERRSMEELMESRKTAMPFRQNPSRPFTPHLSDSIPGGLAPTAEPGWEPWGSGLRDTATSTAATVRDARSSAIFGVVPSAGDRPGDYSFLHPPGRRGPTAARKDGPETGRGLSAPPTAYMPLPPTPLAPPNQPSDSSSRRQEDRPPPPSPVAPGPLLRAPPLSRSPIVSDSRRQGRPRPRQAPSEGGDVGGLGRNASRDDCEPEGCGGGWAGGSRSVSEDGDAEEGALCLEERLCDAISL